MPGRGAGEAGFRGESERLAAQLRELWALAQAERPDITLGGIERIFERRKPPYKLATSTVWAWMSGEGAPSKAKEEAYLALVSYLQDLVPEQHRRRIEAWENDLEAARHESRGRKTGRPSEKGRRGKLFTVFHGDPVAEALAPDDLEGREAELAELTAFALEQGGGKSGYWWWRAEPWAGKTALMASFTRRVALTKRVDVVSYFVSDSHRVKFGAGEDRKDFLRKMTDQLAAVVDQRHPQEAPRKPRLSPRALRDSRLLLDLYKEAAAASQSRGRTLLLVVDGLDEELATVENESIAPLLPKPVPPGMRVLVSSRTAPFVPDVEADHPLRDPEIVRALTPSSKALAIRDRAKTELYRLLRDPLGYQILGLMAVARGGLGVADLAELIGEMAENVRQFDVEDILRGEKGRSMSPEGLGPETYVLAHTELREAALMEMAKKDVRQYGILLRAWADRYAEQDWPQETPSYLLSGYVGLLSCDGDVERLRGLVLDPRWQLRISTSSRTDLALAELDGLVESVLETSEEDRLSLLAAVAVSRHFLGERQPTVRRVLPSAFALLGDVDRALALARSPRSAEGKAARLADVAGVLVEVQDGRAAETAREAAAWARRCGWLLRPGFVDEDVFGPTVVDTAIALMRTGQEGNALNLLRAVNAYGPTVPEAARAAAVLRPLDPAGAMELLDGLEGWAETIAGEDGGEQALPVEVWAEVARADSGRAERLYRRISDHARAHGPDVLAFAASALVEARPEIARSLADAAVSALTEMFATVDRMQLPARLPQMLARTVRAMVDTGAEPETAERFLDSVPEALGEGFDVTQAAYLVLAKADADALADSVLLRQIGTMKEQDRIPEARSVLEGLLADVHGTGDVPLWLPALAEAVAICAMAEDAERLAVHVPDDAGRARLFAAVAAGCAVAGRQEAALRHAVAAESLISPDDPAEVLDAVAQAIALAGKTAAAQALAKPTEGGAGRTRREAEWRGAVVAAGLRVHDPVGASSIVGARLDELGPSGGRFTPLHELAALLLGVDASMVDTRGPLEDLLWAKVQGWQHRKSDDLLVHAVLCIADERYGDFLPLLEELERQATNVSAHPLRVAGFSVVLALLGDFDAAGRVARRLGGEAFAAAAGQAAGVPVLLKDAHSGTDRVTTTVRALARSLVPEAPRSMGKAQEFLREALAGNGWHHVLVPLAHSAPGAVGEVLRIAEVHLGRR